MSVAVEACQPGNMMRVRALQHADDVCEKTSLINEITQTGIIPNSKIWGMIYKLCRVVERRLLFEQFKILVNSMGEDVLSAGDEGDLYLIIDSRVKNGTIEKIGAIAAQLMMNDSISCSSASNKALDIMRESYDSGLFSLFEKGLSLTNAANKAVNKILESYPLLDLAQKERPPISFLDNKNVPTEIASRLLMGYMANACFMAIICTASMQKKPAPWISKALAEQWIQNCEGYLGYIAAIQGSDVPPNIIPSDKILDLDAVYARHRRAQMEAKRLSDLLLESGEDVIAPYASHSSI